MTQNFFKTAYELQNLQVNCSGLSQSRPQFVGAKLKACYSDDPDHLTCVCNLLLFKMDFILFYLF